MVKLVEYLNTLAHAFLSAAAHAAKEGVKEDITLAKKVAPALKDVTP